MTRELKCRYCAWESAGYSDDMKAAFKEAKTHAKNNHRKHWDFWAWQGKVLLEMFTVVTRVRGENE